MPVPKALERFINDLWPGTSIARLDLMSQANVISSGFIESHRRPTNLLRNWGWTEIICGVLGGFLLNKYIYIYMIAVEDSASAGIRRREPPT